MSVKNFSEVTVGDELPERLVPLHRVDLVRYSGVSGDPNPIHWNDKIATMVGLPDVVAHGMLTMGLAAGFITDWLGDPGKVLEYNVRFTSPVFVPNDETGAQVHFAAKVKSVDESDKTAVIAVVARSNGRKIFGRATATVQLG